MASRPRLPLRLPTDYSIHQQRMQMSSLFADETFNENNIVILNETDKTLVVQQTVPSDVNQQIIVFRLLSPALTLLRSLRVPHFTDRTLRIIFLSFIALIGSTSFTIALIVGSSVVQFKQQCPLYASFQFQTVQTAESNLTVKIIPLSEKFTSQSTCDFCTFYNVFTFIYCIMTGFFFILFNDDNRIMANNDRCLIIPW